MRISAVLFASLVIATSPSHAASPRVEYGKPSELRKVKSIFVSCAVDPAVKQEAETQLSKLLPALVFADSEASGDVTLSLGRTMAESPVGGGEIVTSAVVGRGLSGRSPRLYLDASSKNQEIPAAVGEVIAPLVKMLQEVNPDRFGPSAGESLLASGKPKVHSTAGLHAGLSRNEVLIAIGSPDRIVKRTLDEIWFYRTTQGSMRLVFSGGTLSSMIVESKK